MCGYLTWVGSSLARKYSAGYILSQLLKKRPSLFKNRNNCNNKKVHGLSQNQTMLQKLFLQCSMIACSG